jgi:rhomboid protease GluP
MAQFNFALYYGALFETLDELRITFSAFNENREIPVYVNKSQDYISIVQNDLQQMSLNTSSGLENQEWVHNVFTLLIQKLNNQSQHHNYENSFHRKMKIWGYIIDAEGNYMLSKKKPIINTIKEVLSLKKDNSVTIIIIALNILVFISMALFTTGRSIMSPSATMVGSWGGSSINLCYNGNQWWRLFTATFLHYGIIHIVFNMGSLFDIGSTVERMYGKLLYTTAYITCGIVASIASICWNGLPVSAGASGAIFGVLGMYLGLTLTNFFPKEQRKNIIKSLSTFAIINIIMAISIPTIDNVAHIGGLLTGIAIALLCYIVVRKKALPKSNFICITAMVAMIALITIVWLQPRIALHKQIKVLNAKIDNANKSIFNQPINDFLMKKIEKEYIPEVDNALAAFPKPKFYLGGKYVKTIKEHSSNFKMLVLYEVKHKLYPESKQYAEMFEYYNKKFAP